MLLAWDSRLDLERNLRLEFLLLGGLFALVVSGLFVDGLEGT